MPMKPPASVGMSLAAGRYAGAADRSRCVRGQPQAHGRLRPQGRHPRCGRMPRRTSRPTSPSARSRWGRWACAARRCRRPRPWSMAASAMCWSPTRWRARPSWRGWRRWPSVPRSACASTTSAAWRSWRRRRTKPAACSTCWWRSTSAAGAAAWRPGAAAARIAERIAGARHLCFAGLQAYHGSAQHVRAASERREQHRARGGLRAGDPAGLAGGGARGARDRRRRHRHVRARDGEPRLHRAAARLLRLHGCRLCPQPARRRRSVRHLSSTRCSCMPR